MFGRRKKSKRISEKEIEAHGISKTSKSVLKLAEMLSTISTAIADKKVSIAEWLGIGTDAGQFAFSLKDFEEIKTELGDLSEDEFATLTKVFEDNFDLNNKEAEQKVEQSLKLLLLIKEIIS